ncbi:NAD(P)-dependent dehydrogenase, short-chain alcohol dehydrogenase family [Bosea lupini]|uniref:NAD(P)-dependent dehydrogenase, short-chain alcohol dehydrogenase family n=1 Tax=Bosea lupini TaxID=1036779 RepID=A0A1H7T453_9HYPH|nr:SDR family oxidoreductase [Bosea lupini]SEL79583.1 NAD(P)-dependent dehydrogenase, short-chain alcohol dehydrogenase family [Bosea lupini]
MAEAVFSRHALITGSSSGIGLALAQRLLAAGWRVTGIDRQAAPTEAEAAGLRTVPLDLLDAAALASALPDILAERPDAFVHCAGLMRTGRITEIRDEDMETLWRLHVGAAIAILRELVPILPDIRGRIVLLSSRGALGRPGRGAYAASKAALQGLARSLALELAPHGITVNVVAPAATDTPMLRDPGRGEAPAVSLPLGRLIAPDEVAYLVQCLLAPEAGAITGQTLYVCGGASLVAPS